MNAHVAAEVAAPVVPVRTRYSTAVRAVAPFVIGGAVLLVPTPEGLSANAWHFFAPLGGLIRTGPTHTNVGDLRVVLVDRIECD